MNSLLGILEKNDKFNSYIKDLNEGVNPMMLSGLTDSGKVHLSYATRIFSQKPICLITYNEMQARKLTNGLRYYDKDVCYFPKREIVTYDYLAESKELLNERIDCLNKIKSGKGNIVVTTIEAVMQKTISKEVLYKHQLSLKVGKEYKLDSIKEELVNLGYERFEIVEGRGQFSIRGGIVDIAVAEKEGIRIEFWGDEIDSIRKFNVYTQRSTEMLQEIEIYPANEFILEKPIEKICYEIEKGNYADEDLEEIRNGNYLNKVDKYFNSFYEEQNSILDYISEDYIIVVDEIRKIKQRAENLIKDNKNVIKNLIERGKTIPEALKVMDTEEEIERRIENRQILYIENQDMGFVDSKTMHAKRNGYSFSYREVNFFRFGLDLFFEEIEKAKKARKIIVIVAGSKDNAKKVSSLLLEKEINNVLLETLDIELDTNAVYVVQGSMETGFEAYDFNLLVLSAGEIFTTKKPRAKSNKIYKDAETIVFADLKIGDYVVHKSHGIGQFVGVNTITADKVTKDYIKIKYRGDDILYIPTNQLDNIRKYVGVGEKTAPNLNSLGNKEWSNTKRKVKANLQEVARELLELYAKREKAVGFAFSADTPWQTQFENSFEYEETDDQLRCIEEMKKDMESQKPMDRLLCGDVGYGKTEVAIRGAFKACMDGKQVAYLVPTTILANQQYESFKDRMKEFPIRIELLNRFRTKKQQEEVVKKLKLGEVDIVIGTHRLLSKDIEFKNLGMLIVDEEQRFGVRAKEKIKEMKNNVDVLTMTATPIPRTLHMSVVGIRDMSVIYEPPQNRKQVQTYVLEYDEEVVKEAITKELERNGQVFYLYNKVESIERKANEIQELVPEAKVVYAHGKMSGNEIEEIMEEFIKGETNVLVCTTILESGIDIPNANTIIVENADRLGLAQLYQIRGRVGRSDRQAYAYITYKRDKMLSEEADKRLKAIKEFTEFGSGFKVAMRDLEIRGAGSLLGEMQHGHLDQVGYDMYCKILDEVVKEMKGIKVEEEIDVQIDINVSSYIPDEFIDDSTQKIEIYQNIALCKNEEDIQNVVDEIIDRYGRIPEEIENLLEVTRIKNLCRQKGIIKIMQKENNVIFYFDIDKFNGENIQVMLDKYKNRMQFSLGRNNYITIKNIEQGEIIKEIKEFLEIC